MRKILILSVVMAFLCTFVSCGDKTPESSGTVTESIPQNATELPETETTSETVTESDTVTTSTGETTTTVSESVQTSAESTAETTILTAATSENNSTDGTGEGSTSAEEESDEELIIKASEFFETACQIEWKYTVGSPYELDMSQTVKNMYGWDSYLVTTEGINSLADVRADYHKIFAEDYPDTLDELYTESDGRVYCLSGGRGSNIFYDNSVITSVNGRSENEISFTVTNYYNSDDFGGEAYTVEDEFVISVDSSGEWRVLKFRLPY